MYILFFKSDIKCENNFTTIIYTLLDKIKYGIL